MAVLGNSSSAPEPGTLAFLAIGGVALTKRRRK
ncbi:PEP-CTERM sorting domain-containing protein [Armatimonas sp.]